MKEETKSENNEEVFDKKEGHVCSDDECKCGTDECEFKNDTDDVVEFPADNFKEEIFEGQDYDDGDFEEYGKRIVDISQFDCGEILQIQNEINQAKTRTNSVAGDIERSKEVLKRLKGEEFGLQEKLNEKTREIKKRYQLDDEFDWQVDPYTGTATGKRKDG